MQHELIRKFFDMKSKYRIDQGQISCDIASEPIAMAESRISENPNKAILSTDDSFQSSWNRALSIDEFRELCYHKLTEIYAQGD